MLFLYAGLARFEERQMSSRYGDSYRELTAGRGSFLPGSPVRRLFEATLGRLRPRALGWILGYVFCLSGAFAIAFALRAHTIEHTAMAGDPQRMLVISVWLKRLEGED